MKSVPGIGMRGDAGDRPARVLCTCGGVAITLLAGERLVREPRGEARVVITECCRKELRLRVEVDRG